MSMLAEQCISFPVVTESLGLSQHLTRHLVVQCDYSTQLFNATVQYATVQCSTHPSHIEVTQGDGLGTTKGTQRLSRRLHVPATLSINMVHPNGEQKLAAKQLLNDRAKQVAKALVELLEFPAPRSISDQFCCRWLAIYVLLIGPNSRVQLRTVEFASSEGEPVIKGFRIFAKTGLKKEEHRFELAGLVPGNHDDARIFTGPIYFLNHACVPNVVYDEHPLSSHGYLRYITEQIAEDTLLYWKGRQYHKRILERETEEKAGEKKGEKEGEDTAKSRTEWNDGQKRFIHTKQIKLNVLISKFPSQEKAQSLFKFLLHLFTERHSSSLKGLQRTHH
ncbi:hypothetical protein FPV67DRAFT_1452958 [Lyophyllum atratum]|nr:hypothetical protein FPV67DRAFT_1452958 [Lyophyllum atratum]